MRLFLPRPLALFFFVTLVGAMPFAAGSGCGRTACFAFSRTAWVKNGNACPAQAQALPNFTDPQCPGPVVSVDGEGSFDGELCCYPVTEEEIQPNCGQGGGSSGGVGGRSGSSGFVSGTGEFSGSGSGEGGFGSGSAPPPMCTSSCAESITLGGAPCSAGATQFSALTGCACIGACSSQCEKLCVGAPIDSSCSACLEAECETELTNCENN